MSTVVVVTARDYELRAAFAGVAPASPIRVGPLPAAVGYVDGTRLVGLVGGVGAIVAGVVASSALSLIDECAVIVSAGIAGAFAGRATLGDVVVATEVVVADLGMRDNDGFVHASDLGWASTIGCPPRLVDAALAAGANASGQLLTVSAQSAAEEVALELTARFPDAVGEAMEGGGVGLAASLFDVPFVEVRGISNIVGVRDRELWNKPAALEPLGAMVVAIASAASQD